MHRPAHRKLILLLLGGACGMFAFGFLLVPLYDVLCQITGLNGKTGGPYLLQSEVAVDPGRQVTVQFITHANAGMPWRFAVPVREMTVLPGALTRVDFSVTNPTDRTMVAQAIPSVSPAQAAAYLNKIQCFCFEQQRLEPGASQQMPLHFMVSPELPVEIGKLTLSYTLFDITARVAPLQQAAGGRSHDDG